MQRLPEGRGQGRHAGKKRPVGDRVWIKRTVDVALLKLGTIALHLCPWDTQTEVLCRQKVVVMLPLGAAGTQSWRDWGYWVQWTGTGWGYVHWWRELLGDVSTAGLQAQGGHPWSSVGGTLASSYWQRCRDGGGKNSRTEWAQGALEEVGSVFGPLGDHSGDFLGELGNGSDSQGHAEKAPPPSSSLPHMQPSGVPSLRRISPCWIFGSHRNVKPSRVMLCYPRIPLGKSLWVTFEKISVQLAPSCGLLLLPNALPGRLKTGVSQGAGPKPLVYCLILSTRWNDQQYLL